MSDVKYLLTEAYDRMETDSDGLKPYVPQNFKKILGNDQYYSNYVQSLSEGLTGSDKEQFITLAENTRVPLMENSMFALNPYETMTLPILRVFYPRLIAKELVNVVPMDKPEVIKVFIKAAFTRWANGATEYNFPSINNDISKGPSAGISAVATGTVGTKLDLLGAINGSLNNTMAHIEKNFRITKVIDATAGETAVDIRPDVDGNFSANVTVNGDADTIVGVIDYEAGTLIVESDTGEVVTFQYEATASLDENQINPKMKFIQEKVRLVAEDRQISSEWTIQMEQDAKALFDIQLQSEFVNIMADQIALDLDREVINDLINYNASQNGADHLESFYKTPDASFTWGTKAWYEQDLIPRMSSLSAQIYKSSHMGSANTIACNPLDAAILESFNTFAYDGHADTGGTSGYQSATVQGGKWKVLVSSVVPQGKMIFKYRSPDTQRAVYVLGPYVPALLSPFPLGNVPSLTVLTRYARKMIRPEGVGVMEVFPGQRV